MGRGVESLPMFLSPAELSELTGEHVNSIRRGIVEGRIPADKVNGRWRICRDVVFANAMGLAAAAAADGRGPRG